MITVVTVEMTRRHFVRHHKKGNDFSPLGYISEIGSKLSLSSDMTGTFQYQEEEQRGKGVKAELGQEKI